MKNNSHKKIVYQDNFIKHWCCSSRNHPSGWSWWKRHMFAYNVSQNDDTKNKVTSLEIIVRMIDSKPYYEIKYKKVDEDYYQVGYSSYNLNNVLKWRDECFELVNVKTTNSDRIRNMSDEELAEWISTKDTCGQCAYELECVCMKVPCTNGILKWLQSEAEQE